MMDMNNSSSTTSIPKRSPYRWSFWIIGVAFACGFALSILSWLELCVEHCSANQNFRLLGLPFAVVGIIFFLSISILHFFSARIPFLSQVVSWLIATSLGAEIVFIGVQKYQIGHWCPLCLSIAATIGLAAFTIGIGYAKKVHSAIQHNNGDEIMRKIKQSFAWLSFAALGFFMAFVGVTKPDSSEAAIADIKDRMTFGAKDSYVEVYFVTDWYCPSCRKVEPLVEKIYPKIKSKAAIYFIDYPIHKKSLNFSPYNLAFLVNDKQHYFRARDVLAEIADKTDTPNDEEIKKEAKKKGLKFKELTYLEIKSGLEYFDKIVDQFKLNSTPTILIVNRARKAVVKLEGRDEISEEKILDSIDKLSPHKKN